MWLHVDWICLGLRGLFRLEISYFHITNAMNNLASFVITERFKFPVLLKKYIYLSSYCFSITLLFPRRSTFIVWAAQHELELRAAACSSSPPLRRLLWICWPITTSGMLPGFSSRSHLLIISMNTAVEDCRAGPVWCVDEVQSLTLIKDGLFSKAHNIRVKS